MLAAFCSATDRTARVPRLVCLTMLLVHYSLPSFRPPARVPTTRARIFANAVSRVVEVSSQNGEKPQSSVVPSWPTGMYSAA